MNDSLMAAGWGLLIGLSLGSGLVAVFLQQTYRAAIAGAHEAVQTALATASEAERLRRDSYRALQDAHRSGFVTRELLVEVLGERLREDADLRARLDRLFTDPSPPRWARDLARKEANRG